MNDAIVLGEHRDHAVDLSPEDALFVATSLGKRISIRRTVTGSQYILNPGQFAGVASLPSGRRLECRPKVPVSSLLYMLAIASDLPSLLLDEWADFDRFDEILEFVAGHFVDLVEEQLARGLYRDYVEREDNLSAIRGRIAIAQDIRRNAVNRQFTFCRYGDFTWDIPENQVIRQVVHLLGVWNFAPALRGRLWRLDGQLGEVSPAWLPLGTFDRFRYHRLNAGYEPIHSLCWLFLSGASLSEHAGDFRFPGFLIDMNDVFEAFVTRILRKHLAPELAVADQVAETLDEERRIGMRVDLKFMRGGRVVAVGDCKYKLQSEQDAKVADVYQVLAYATALRVTRGFLFYPAHEKSAEDELRIRHSEVRIWRMPIDLGVEPKLLLAECARFAARVRERLNQPLSARDGRTELVA